MKPADRQGVDSARPEDGICDNHHFATFAADVVANCPISCCVLETLDSTNGLARKVVETLYATDGNANACWFVGYQQTAGRGRLGRSWVSDAGRGIYATLVLPLEESAGTDRLLSLPLAVGVASCRALKSSPGAEKLALKWPNDLLVDGKKLGGILIEIVEGTDGKRCAIVGIGINHGHDQDSVPQEAATSLRLLAEASSSRPLTLVAAIDALTRSVLEEVLTSPELEDVIDQYREFSMHQVGDQLTWCSSTGPIRGTFEGFDDRGCIMLRSDQGRISVSAGDILLPSSEPAADPRTNG